MNSFFAQTQQNIQELLKGNSVDMALFDLTQRTEAGYLYTPREIKDTLASYMEPMENTAPIWDLPYPYRTTPVILGFIKDPQVNTGNGIVSGIVKLSSSGIEQLAATHWRICMALKVDTKVIPVHVLQFGNFYADLQHSARQ